VPDHFKGTKKIEICGISSHNNTKFLHTIADVCLCLMHKKWNSYTNLEPDTTTENSEVRITTFIVSTCPLQFIHCAEVSFRSIACEIQLSLLLPVIQF
jgi:hypothetical protein